MIEVQIECKNSGTGWHVEIHDSQTGMSMAEAMQLKKDMELLIMQAKLISKIVVE